MKPLSFQREDHDPIPAIAGPKYIPRKPGIYKHDMAMQEAIRRSDRQPRLLSMNAKTKEAKKK